MKLLEKITEAPRAFTLAMERDLLPSALSAREQREAFAAALRSKAVFSARVTSADFLARVREVIGGVTSGEINHATARTILRQTLDDMGYTAEGGFPDAEELVEPAIAGTLQDLRSFRRLDLIVNTQVALMQGRARKQRGQDNITLYPAWELVRFGQREVPRDWPTRFEQAGGELLDKGEGGIGGRMIAHKNDSVWSALGDSALFDDALDVSHPPFAFNSGMNWREVSMWEWMKLGGQKQEADPEAGKESLLPPNVASPATREAIEAILRDHDQVEQDGKRVSAGDLREMERRRNREEYAKRYGLSREEVGL